MRFQSPVNRVPPEPDDVIAVDTGDWPDNAIVAIAAVAGTRVLGQDRRAHCWGRNIEGQLNAPDTDPRVNAAGR